MLDSAAKENLYNVLGFEEGNFYFSYITGNKDIANNGVSYSKKYRLLKELFEIGAVAKCKLTSKDSFSYFFLPPSCIINNGCGEKIMNYLENIYLKNFFNQWKGFIELTVKNENSLIGFIINKFTEKIAEINVNNEIIDKIINEDVKKVIKIKEQTLTKNNTGQIDNKIYFEFMKPFDDFSKETVGYIAFTESMNCKDEVLKIKNRFL